MIYVMNKKKKILNQETSRKEIVGFSAVAYRMISRGENTCDCDISVYSRYHQDAKTYR